MIAPPVRIVSGTLFLLSFAQRRHHTEDIRRSICAALGWSPAESYDDLRVHPYSDGVRIWISDALAPRERVNELIGLLALVFDPDTILLRRGQRKLPEPLRASIKELAARK